MTFNYYVRCPSTGTHVQKCIWHCIQFITFSVCKNGLLSCFWVNCCILLMKNCVNLNRYSKRYTPTCEWRVGRCWVRKSIFKVVIFWFSCYLRKMTVNAIILSTYPNSQFIKKANLHVVLIRQNGANCMCCFRFRLYTWKSCKAFPCMLNNDKSNQST